MAKSGRGPRWYPDWLRTMQVSVIDYDALIEAYRRSLTSVLRGFRPGDFEEPFLATWVPDEDDAKSLEAMFEAAAAGKIARLSVQVGAATLARVPERRIEDVASRFGAVTSTREGDAFVVHVTLDGRSTARQMAHLDHASAARPRRSAAGPGVPPVGDRALHYDAAIRAAAPFTHAGSAPSSAAVAGATRVVVDHEGASLEALIDDRGTIVSARHTGGEGDVPAVLDLLCRIVESQPIREAADHGAARLELALRGRGGARVVPGIVSPANADPRIGACIASLRGLLAAYVRAAGPVTIKNEFVPSLGARWGGASPAEREALAHEALRIAAAELSLAPHAVALAAVTGDTRVVVDFTDDVPRERRPLLLLQLERSLKARLDDALTVYVEEMADKNRIRRLVPKPSAGGSTVA
jgi:hypothetical protein